MSGTTVELNLATAIDSDDNADYLTISLANSLRTVDALFNNLTGHNHGGAHQGGIVVPVAGSITSAMIADGTITTVDLAPGAVSQVVFASSLTGESTTSTSTVPMTAPVASLTTVGGQLLALFTGSFYNGSVAGGAEMLFAFRVDSGPWNLIADIWTPAATYRFPITLVMGLGAPAAGAHTVSVGWQTSANTLTATTTSARVLTVVELKV
jgi:hypothetical protein